MALELEKEKVFPVMSNKYSGHTSQQTQAVIQSFLVGTCNEVIKKSKS